MDRSIRKSIYKDEIEYFFSRYEITEQKRAEFNITLFENPDTFKIFLLKKDITNLKGLENMIGKVFQDPKYISTIKNIFCVDDDLKLPKELKNEFLLNNRKLAFFIGAGVSKLLGIPLWGELSEKALQCLEDKGHLNKTETLKVRTEGYSAKQIISIFHKMEENKDNIKKFYHDNLKKKEAFQDNPYEILFNLEDTLKKPIVKITSNIDNEWRLLLKEKQDKQEIEIEGLLKTKENIFKETIYKNFRHDLMIENNVLYQIHGNIDDVDSLVMTTSDYVTAYRDDKGLKGFLENLFRGYCVIFIGSSVQEFEILEYCLKASPSSKHFALVGINSGEENIFRIKKEYYSDINVTAVPYYLDFQKWDRLILLLNSWEQEIKESLTRSFYKDTEVIDEVL
jgi:NAD-dependent SIR2 family protein deacetylase